jgi:hypothetical protein
MGEIHSKSCTRDPNIFRFEQLAEKDKHASEFNSAFGDEVREFFKTKTPNERFQFLDQMRNCFDAERKLHPDVNLPKMDWLPRPIEIV